MEKTDMPVLEEVSLNLFRNVNLNNVLLIACQHIQMPQYCMFNKFFQKGLLPCNSFIFGKCYSTDKKALNLFVKRGAKVSKASEEFDSHKSYDEQHQEHVKKFLIEINKSLSLSKFNKVILLDDGGFLIEFANKYLVNVKNIAGVEQTSSGYYRLKNLKIRFPVINVARSKAKLIYETPIIINQFLKNLNYELKKLKCFNYWQRIYW